MNEIFEKIVVAVQEGLESIFKRPDLLIMQLCATIILFLILRFAFWKKITSFIEKRQAKMEEDLAIAKEEKEKAKQLRKDTVLEYESVKKESKDLKEQLNKEAHKEKDRILTEARQEAKRRLEQVELDIQHEIRENNEKMKKTIKEIAFTAAEKIVKHEIEKDAYDEIIEEAIEESII